MQLVRDFFKILSTSAFVPAELIALNILSIGVILPTNGNYDRIAFSIQLHPSTGGMVSATFAAATSEWEIRRDGGKVTRHKTSTETFLVQRLMLKERSCMELATAFESVWQLSAIYDCIQNRNVVVP